MFEDIYSNKNTEELWDECRRKEEEIIGISESSSIGFFGSGNQKRGDKDIEENARNFIHYYENEFLEENNFDQEVKDKMIELIEGWLDAIK